MTKTVVHKDLKSFFGSDDLLEVSQERSFSQMIFELLTEKEPSEDELKIFELILNLSIDHGPDTPSAKEVIESAKKGESISEAVAAGVGQINDTHGGAIEPAMKILYQVKKKDISIEGLVKQYLSQDKKIPGFGHRIYKETDPRADLIFEKLKQTGIGGDYLMIIVELQNEIANKMGKRLPINIDGAIAVALCGLGWDAKLGKAVFIVARTPGLVGQYLNNFK